MARTLIFVFVLFYSQIQGQTKQIVSLNELDSIYNIKVFKSFSISIEATIHSFGKSRDNSLTLLDSLGLIKKKKYKTSFLVSLLNDNSKVYVPVSNKEFKRWYNKYFTDKNPTKVILTIRLFSEQKFFNHQHYFIIQKFKLSGT